MHTAVSLATSTVVLNSNKTSTGLDKILDTTTLVLPNSVSFTSTLHPVTTANPSSHKSISTSTTTSTLSRFVISLENVTKIDNQTIQLSDGSIFKGEWKENEKLNGFGILYNPNSEKIKYEGEWANGTFNGNGTEFSTNGTLEYKGEFKDGFKHGKGQHHHFEADAYFGEFKENKKNGFGTLLYPNCLYTNF